MNKIWIVALVMVIMGTGVSYGQEDKGKDAFELENIVVTAQKRQENAGILHFYFTLSRGECLFFSGRAQKL